MKKLYALLLLAGVISLLAFTRQQGQYSFIRPHGWPKPVYNFRKHPLTADKIALGRRLFSETLLSRDNTISCSSCHLANTAFTHIDHNLSHGIEGRIGIRNSPALMNLAWSSDLMWDGAIAHLDEQAQTPITNPLEMDETMEHAVAKVQSKAGYRVMFDKAFGDSTVTAEQLMQALSQFMLTLVSADAKYDRVMNGSAVFSAREANGYNLFRRHCAECHKEPLFTNGEFENNGLPADTALMDIGRMKLTGKRQDSLRFKIPTLRNVEVTYPYMHDGRFRNLQMVLFHYSDQVQHGPTLSSRLPGKLSLSQQEKSDIILFLKTLTDESFLKNKNYIYQTDQSL